MADVDNQNQTIDELMGELEESRSDGQHLQRYTSRIESELEAAQRRVSLLEASQPDVVLAERASEEEVAQQEAESELEDHTLRLRSKLAALEADLEQVPGLRDSLHAAKHELAGARDDVDRLRRERDEARLASNAADRLPADGAGLTGLLADASFALERNEQERLEQGGRIAELEAQVEVLGRKRDDAEAMLGEVRRGLECQEAEQAGFVSRTRDAESRAGEAETRAAERAAQLGQAEDRAETLADSLETTRSEREEAQGAAAIHAAAVERRTGELADLLATSEELEGTLTSTVADLEAARLEKGQSDAHAAELRLAQDELAARVTSEEEARASAEAWLAEAKARGEALQADLDQARSLLAQVSEEKAQAFQAQLSSESHLNQAREERDEARGRIREMEDDRRSEAMERESAVTAWEQERAGLEAAQSSLGALLGEAQDSLGAAEAALGAVGGERDVAQSELGRLSVERDRMAGEKIVAEEELERSAQRLEALTHEQRALNTAHEGVCAERDALRVVNQTAQRERDESEERVRQVEREKDEALGARARTADLLEQSRMDQAAIEGERDEALRQVASVQDREAQTLREREESELQLKSAKTRLIQTQDELAQAAGRVEDLTDARATAEAKLDERTRSADEMRALLGHASRLLDGDSPAPATPVGQVAARPEPLDEAPAEPEPQPEPVAVIAPPSEPITGEALEELVEDDELEEWGELEELEVAPIAVEPEPRKTVPDVAELREEMQALADARGALAPQRNRARWTVPLMGVLIVAGLWFMFRLLAASGG